MTHKEIAAQSSKISKSIFVFEGLLYLNEADDLREDIKNELQFE